jgi:hypothetical protein
LNVTLTSPTESSPTPPAPTPDVLSVLALETVAAFETVTPYLCGIPIEASGIAHPDCLLPVLLYACARERPDCVSYTLEEAPDCDVGSEHPVALTGVRVSGLEIIDLEALRDALRSVAMGPSRCGIGYDADGILTDGVESDLGAALEDFAETSGFSLDVPEVTLSMALRS